MGSNRMRLGKLDNRGLLWKLYPDQPGCPCSLLYNRNRSQVVTEVESRRFIIQLSE